MTPGAESRSGHQVHRDGENGKRCSVGEPDSSGDVGEHGSNLLDRGHGTSGTLMGCNYPASEISIH